MEAEKENYRHTDYTEDELEAAFASLMLATTPVVFAEVTTDLLSTQEIENQDEVSTSIKEENDLPDIIIKQAEEEVPVVLTKQNLEPKADGKENRKRQHKSGRKGRRKKGGVKTGYKPAPKPGRKSIR
ncbi:uncharacterized protein LOC119670106 isoform X2 [Teleopsis dalmanni]|uniref:uncharacterized protein LOC119667307 n=1 Tax=Teleopsis dalmanni TaxID=139649 RepID=UPI0018CD2327|nr:uncharacterized protein LOC119667307 [Teleopsis dalmanni]XP_037933264.1 uncharacterized protein LOC119667981 [Teleopsis dalmanni]XP_037936153.1 uncharacterized protein LOC119670106 isoform X2 [Teleopsis dalmanni]